MLITGPVVLVWHSSGCPMDVTLTVIDPGTKLAEMQGVGPGPAGGGITMAHPVIIKGADDTGTGVPISKPADWVWWGRLSRRGRRSPGRTWLIKNRALYHLQSAVINVD